MTVIISTSRAKETLPPASDRKNLYLAVSMEPMLWIGGGRAGAGRLPRF